MDIGSMPPVTRLWAFSSLAVSLAEHISLLSRYSLFYSPSLTFNLTSPQIYRCITSFLYFGEFGIDFLFHLFFFIRYSRMLEENHYAGHTADFAWLVVVCGSLLLLTSPLITPPLPFLSSPLAFTLVYIWSRRNRHIRLSLFGVLVITAPYLPIALCAFSWILTGSAQAVKGDLLGLAVGHVYYFFADVWPREVRSGGRHFLKTPALFTRLVEGRPQPAPNT
ncbi:Der1-like protein [Microstroma glucosiphilum]|uniref:Derlin n=1 Tax=Pseudomicrostroma glucosiphilum TaxID=1684307 RepID=A0A316U9U1_9BASI|nr:Der1-like protein [Pseudomicrostroma glucosiphilum]PWN19775.1 Der1-like protein [Pseudomicrostroma glucosiphilum]